MLLWLTLAAWSADDPALDQVMAEVLSELGNHADPAKLTAYLTGCKADKASDCASLGQLYQQQADSDNAKLWFHRACKLEQWTACNSLIAMGDPRGKTLIATQHRQPCKGGSSFACDQLLLMTDDEQERIWARERACNLGAGPACYSLSLYETGQNRDPGPALKRACELGNPDGCTDWKRYEDQQLRVQSAARCGPKDSSACVVAAEALIEGMWHRDRAPALLETACAAKNRRGCTLLAELLPRDDPRVAKLQKQSCKAGDLDACHAVADRAWYDDDDHTAFDAGCDKQHAPSCVSAGLAWIDRDAERAVAQLQTACGLDLHGCTVLAEAIEPLGWTAVRAGVERLKAVGGLDWTLIRSTMRGSRAGIEPACEAGDQLACAALE